MTRDDGNSIGRPIAESGAREPIPLAAVPDPRRTAAEGWLRDHGDVLWRFVRGRSPSAETAEEIVQETLLAALQQHDRFAGRSGERTWLLGIAAHKIADYYRRAARVKHRSGTDDDACGCEACRTQFTKRGKWRQFPAEWAPPADSAAELAEQLEALNRCIAALPPGQREALWLRELLEMPTEAVCKELGLTPTNLWTRLHRARAALRTCLEKVFGRSETTNS